MENPRNRNWLIISGLLFLVVPVAIFAMWVFVFTANPAAQQTEKVKIFQSWFPSFLRSNSLISLLVIIFSIASILFSLIGQKMANKTFRIVGILVVIAASFVLLLQFFSML